MYIKSDIDQIRVSSLLRPHLKEFLWGGISMIIYVGCWPLLAWLAGILIPAIGNGDLKVVINVIFLALVVFLIQKAAQFSQDTLLAKPALWISQELRKDLFRKLQKIELPSLNKLSAGDLTYRLTEDADRVGEVIYKGIQDTVPCIFQLITIFIYMVFLDWQLSLATVILAPLITILISKFGKRVMMAAENSQKQVSELASLLGEAIQGLPLIRAFAAEEWMQNRFESEVEEHRLARYKTLKLIALQHPVIGFIEASGILTILAFGAIRINSEGLNSAQFSSYVAALLMLIDPISHLTTNFNEIQQGKASYKRLKDLEREPLEKDTSNINNVLNKDACGIIFKNVSFSYDNKNIILNKINIEIKEGEIIALVGPSGAGKSTIFSLILRFIRPTNGCITLAGHPITNIKSKELRTKIALVPQSNTVFSGTIANAIRFGRPAEINEIIAAAKTANAHYFINKLPDGYDTYLQERGTNLSGGQLQRIAIARAILGNPSVLLLDEATSALDAEAEAEVQLGLKQAMKSRSVLIIAHRLSTVQEANKIIVLEKGNIIESGNHNQLMKANGRYRDLCEKQLIRDANE